MFNLGWVRDSHETWDFVETRSGMPVNPPFHDQGDEPMGSVKLGNWNGDDGLEYVPRVRERNDWIDGGRAAGLEKGLHAANEDDAPELDYDSGYDCD